MGKTAYPIPTKRSVMARIAEDYANQVRLSHTFAALSRRGFAGRHLHMILIVWQPRHNPEFLE